MGTPEGMINLSNHFDFEAMLRARRPTDESFFQTFDPFVVVCFSAKWCGPCRRINKSYLVENGKAVKWYHCDVDQNETTLGYCGGHSIPAFVLIRDGVFVGRLEGPRDAPHVLEWLSQYGVPVTSQNKD